MHVSIIVCQLTIYYYATLGCAYEQEHMNGMANKTQAVSNNLKQVFDDFDGFDVITSCSDAYVSNPGNLCRQIQPDR